MWDSFASGLGKLSNAAGDLAQSGSKSVTKAIDNAPSVLVWGVIPSVIFYITLLLLIHFGFDFSLFTPCKKNEKKEEECYNTVSYYSIYLLVPLIISIIIATSFYYLVFYIKNPNMAAIGIVSDIMD
jgi:hypothetical protein